MSEQVETDRPARVEVMANPQAGAVARAEARPPAAVRRGLAPEPVARRARPRLFGAAGLVAGFVGLVAVPTAFSAYYFGWVASDVYVTEAKFAVRGSTERLPDSSSAATMVPATLTALNSNQDAYVVRSFIKSVPMIDRLQRDLGLRAMFARDDVDFLSRLPGDASTEKLRAYWDRKVSASVDSLSGVVTLEVRAFAAADGLALSRAIITASEELVNELSRRKRADAVRFANEEVSRAEERVKAAATAMQAFRDETGQIDPVKSAEAVSKLLATLRGEQIELTNELSTARRSLSESAPSVQVLTARLAAVSTQVGTIERELTNAAGATAADRPSTRVLAVYEGLVLEREFSERLYTTVMNVASTARIEADRQQLYLVTFVEPTLAQSALFPQRGSDVLTVFAVTLALWSIVSLLVAAVRDHDA